MDYSLLLSDFMSQQHVNALPVSAGETESFLPFKVEMGGGYL